MSWRLSRWLSGKVAKIFRQGGCRICPAPSRRQASGIAFARTRWRAFCVVSFAGIQSGAWADETSGFYVDLPNVRLWVTDTGGLGDSIILLHANTGTSENGQKQRPALIQAGYRVIALKASNLGDRPIGAQMGYDKLGCSPRYASRTSGFARTSSGRSEAITRPYIRTLMRSASVAIAKHSANPM